jgi:hypothetical protein
MKIKTFINFFLNLSLLIFLILFTFAVCFSFSVVFGFWVNLGYVVDTLHHYNWAVFFSRHFPYVNWFHLQGCGAPFIFLYSPVIYLLELAVRTITKLDLQTVAFGAIFLGFTLSGLWTALAVRIATKSWLLSLTAPFFFFSRVLWGDKNFARGFSIHFLSLAILSFVWYWQKPSKRRKIILIFIVGIGSLFQPVIGLLILGTAACFLLNFRKIKEFFSIMIPVGLIVSAYYLPVRVLSGSHSKYFSTSFWNIATFTDTLRVLFITGITPYVFPIALFALILMLLLARKNLSQYHKKILWGTILVSLAFLIYIFGVFFKLPSAFYFQSQPHYAMALYLSPFLALITAISLKALTKNLPKIIFWLMSLSLLSLLVFLTLSILFPIKLENIKLEMAKPSWEGELYNLSNLEKLFGPPPGDIDYRHTPYHPPNFIGDFFNLRYETPNSGMSIRGLGHKWYSRQMETIRQEGQKKFFYLDWYATRYLYPLYGLPADLVENEEVFTIKIYDEEGAPYGGYLNQPRPILEANASPSVLFVGIDYAHEDWIMALAQANANSSFFIPVKGPQSLSKISEEELAKFDIVYFYNYQYDFKNTDLVKLAQFVKQGGGLVVDTGYGPDMEAERLPDPFPVTRTYTADIKESWQIKKATHPINEEISFTRFSPPLYERQWPWKISTTNSEDIKPWAKLILTSQDKPIVIAGQLDEGRVVWTGLNLLYHLDQFNNDSEEESRLVKNMILWTAKDKLEKSQFTAQFINPEERKITVNTPARGIVFREKFFPGWHVKKDQKKQKIYLAGPDLIYLPLPKDQTYPTQITFDYQTSLIEKGALTLAILTILILLIAFFKKNFLAKFLNPQ